MIVLMTLFGKTKLIFGSGMENTGQERGQEIK